MANRWDHSPLPEELRALRRLGCAGAVWALWLALPLLPWLADRGGMEWDLVAALGAAAALGGTTARRFGRRDLLATALAAGCLLLLGAGRGTLPGALAAGLPFAALALAGMLCDGRALACAAAVLAVQALLPLAGAASLAGAQAQAAGLLGVACLLHLAQRAARRTLRGRGTVLPPAPRRVGAIWTRPHDESGLRGLMVQAERAPDGTVRLAVAAAAAGRVRVTVV